MNNHKPQLDEIQQSIKEVQVDIADIKVDLRTHIKRTDLLEEYVKKVETETKPVAKFVNFIKWLAFTIGLGTAIYTLVNKTHAADLNAHRPARPIENVLKIIQSEVPCRIKIHSHWRSKAHNKDIGGASHSLHIDGRAMDISAVECMSHAQLGKLANKYATVIIYNDHVHIDERVGNLCMVKNKKSYRLCKEFERASFELDF